jgi:hypothetical protein
VGATRLYGVGCSAFLLFHRHEFHPALRTIALLISYDFGMHRAGVFLHSLLLVLVIMLDLVLAM